MTATDGPGAQGQPKGRPGAMTMAMQAVQLKPTGPKVLRIGVIQGGKIIEERVIRKRETVTVGSSEKNNFVVGGADMPQRFELFQLVGSDYILNFTEQMQGRVGLPAGVQDLAQLRSSGAARNAGQFFQVKLTDNSRGKVVIGDVTLLFQFVTPPPIQPRPQLPAAARGGFAKSIDWAFTAFIVFSFMTHFGFVVYLENTDWKIEQGIGKIPEAYAKMIFAEEEPPEPEEKEPDDTAEATEEAEAPTEEAKPTKQAEAAPDAKDAPAPGPTEEEKKAEVADATARMVEEASSAAEALLLGALGSDSGGALNDVLAGGAVTGNAEDVLAQAAGVGVATSSSGGTLRTRSGGGSGERTGGLGGLAAAGKDATKQAGEGGAVTERVVRGSASAGDLEDTGGAGDFDAALVVKAVRIRLGAIKACYETQLRKNPSLSGKVVVQFTIEESGSVTKVNARENTTGDPQVGSCVADKLKSMRFTPGPEGGSVQFEYPFVFAPQG